MLECCDEKLGFQHEKLEIYQDRLKDFMSKVDADFRNHHLLSYHDCDVIPYLFSLQNYLKSTQNPSGLGNKGDRSC